MFTLLAQATEAVSSVPAAASPAPEAVPSEISNLLNTLPETVSSVPPLPEPATGWAKLLDPTWYFDPAPFGDGFPFLLGRPLAAFFVVTLIVAFLLLIRAQLPRLKHRMDVRGTAYWLLFFGLAGSMFLYFRWDYIPYLSMRIWLLLVVAGEAAWLIRRIVLRLRKR